MGKLLEVKWSTTESETYYVDADKYSKAHDHKNNVTLDAFSGTYSFNKATRLVTLDDGVTQRLTHVDTWKLITY